MWNEYKKRFLSTQVFIALALVLAYAVGHMQPQQLGMIFIAMEVGGVIGAWMGAKIKRDVSASDPDDLPLNRR